MPILIDHRERQVSGFLTAAANELNIDTHIHQSSTGDYTITRAMGGEQPVVLACIERKTLKDFADSVRDGRLESEVNKMLALRKKTGCQLFIILEGKPAASDKKVPNTYMKFGTMQKMLAGHSIKHGIFVLYTNDEMNSAETICYMHGKFDSVPDPVRVVCSGDAGAGTVGGDEDADIPDNMSDTTTTQVSHTGSNASELVPEAILMKTESSDMQLRSQMWAKLGGITVPMGQVLDKYICVANMALGQVPRSELVKIKTTGGRNMNAKVVSRLLSVKTDFETQAQLLSGVPGISVDTARLLLEQVGGMIALISTPTEQLKQVKIGSRALGKRASQIHHLLCNRGGEPYPSAPVQ